MKTWLVFALYLVGVSQAHIPLTHDSTKDQIFVQGNWYDKKPSSAESSTPNAFFQQCMHHENASGCTNTWQQRYWVNTDYYQAGGPIFIEIAGEWDAADDINSGYWQQYAYNYNAMRIVLEHRFYGSSFPVQNPTVNDLWLMTSQQALADAARFIEMYSALNNLQSANWVAFGCSYGGNLAAWFKLKYPGHVKTAVSSSGPIEALYDYPGYIKTVSEVIQSADVWCYDKLHSTFTCMEALANGTSNCLAYTDPDTMAHVALRYCYYVDNWAGLSKEIMFNFLSYPGWADNAPSAKVRTSCNLLHQMMGADDIVKYGNFLAARGQNGGCRSSAKEKIDEERTKFLQSKEAWQSGAAGWTWQTCNEFGYFMSSDSELGTFGRNTFSGDVYGSQCSRSFGIKFTRQYIEGQIAATNAYYGGKNIASKCVIFVHGTWDPWHTQGRTTALADNTVVVVPGTEHCADTGMPTTPEMAAAQETINRQIGVYLSDPMC